MPRWVDPADGWDVGWRAWFIVLLLLAMHALTACAAHRKPDAFKYIVIRDAIPNDWRVCVPLWEGAGDELKCLLVHDFRVWLRRNVQAD